MSGGAQVLRVVAGCLFRDGHLLLTQRPAGSHLGGLWEFPGGKVEPGESPEQALRRELREELGIDVEVGPLLETVCHDYPERRVRLEFYRCRLARGEPQPLGCPALAWVTREQLAEYPFPAADAKLLDRLRSSPELWASAAP